MASVGTKNFIDGSWRSAEAAASYLKTLPMHPDRKVVIGHSGPTDIEAAIQAAEAAGDGWRSLSLSQRAGYLGRVAAALADRAEQVAAEMTEETGKPTAVALSEVRAAVTLLTTIASQASGPGGQLYEGTMPGTTVLTRRRPVGVVGIFPPWHSACLSLVAKLGTALVWGNTAVVKLPEWSPRTGLHLGDCFQAAGLPPGVANLLTGAGGDVGVALITDPRIPLITWSGSDVGIAPVVRDLAHAHAKRLQQTLSGLNPLIVLADADLALAVEAAFCSAFGAAGQHVTSAGAIFVQSGIYEAFRGALATRIEKAAVGDPSDPGVEVGPVVNRDQVDLLARAIAAWKDSGGRLIVGTEPASSGPCLCPPSLVEGVPVGSMTPLDGVLGPVAVINQVGSLEEALAECAAIPSMVSAAVFTADIGKAARFQNEVRAGEVHLNSGTTDIDWHVPGGGIDASQWGPRELGQNAANFYTDTVTYYLSEHAAMRRAG